MITIFNRKEVLITMDYNRQAMVRRILAQNSIPCETKIVNLTTSRSSSGRKLGNMGINHSYSYEYKIYVHKNDYEEAEFLIR